MNKRELKRKIEKLKQIKGSNTEVVTLYVPPDKNLNDVTQHIASEISEAENIKSKSTRKNVQSALKKIKNYLQKLNQIPENGIIIFSADTNNIETIETITNLPTPVSSFIYKCDSQPHTEELEKMIITDKDYGLIHIELNQSTIGLLRGESVIEIETIPSLVPGKTTKGGFSQQRYERLRDEAAHEFMKKTAKKAKQIFQNKNIQGIIIGGPKHTVQKFQKEDYLDHELQKQVLGTIKTSHDEKQALKEMVRKGENMITENTLTNKKQKLQNFFKKLAKDGKATYGQQQTINTLKQGAAEEVLIGENVSYETAEQIEKLAKQTSANITTITEDYEEGEQFNKTFKIGAILRYKP